METVAVFNHKGGAGKTSLSFHLAWHYAQLGKRTLIVDLDPQGNISDCFGTEGCLASDIWLKY